MPHINSAWVIYAIRLPNKAARDRTRAALRAGSLSTAIYYPGSPRRPPAYVVGPDTAALPITEGLAGRIRALPIHPELTDADVERIFAAVVGMV